MLLKNIFFFFFFFFLTKHSDFFFFFFFFLSENVVHMTANAKLKTPSKSVHSNARYEF